MRTEERCTGMIAGDNEKDNRVEKCMISRDFQSRTKSPQVLRSKIHPSPLLGSVTADHQVKPYCSLALPLRGQLRRCRK